MATKKPNEVKPLRIPPEAFDYKRQGVARPDDGLNDKEIKKWISYLNSVAFQLREANQQIETREQAIRNRAWRWARVIQGLKRTVEWQAAMMEGANVQKIQKAVRRLARFIPSDIPKVVAQAARRDGDDLKDFPFFTEGFLYPLLGKEDARSFLGRLEDVVIAVGLDANYIHGEADPEEKMAWDEVETELRRS